jgi:hypothetical protein
LLCRETQKRLFCLFFTWTPKAIDDVMSFRCLLMFKCRRRRRRTNFMANGSRIEAPANRAGEVEGNNAQRKGKRIRSQVLSHAHTQEGRL